MYLQHFLRPKAAGSAVGTSYFLVPHAATGGVRDKKIVHRAKYANSTLSTLNMSPSSSTLYR